MIKHFLVLMMLIFLSGCAKMNAQFDCPMKGGLSCASLDDVNAKVDRGEIGESEYASNHSMLVNHITYQPSVYSTKAPLSKPKRIGEKVQHIWIAPFEDTAGHYHGESDIYTVIKPGVWIGYPTKKINDHEE